MATTESFKDFDAARADAVEEPLTFKMGGETWTVRRPLPALALLDIAKHADDQGIGGMVAYATFMEDILDGDGGQWPRFKHMVATAPIGLDELMRLSMWIVEQSTGRPTAALSSLPEPAPSNGQSSPVVSVSPVSVVPSTASTG